MKIIYLIRHGQTRSNATRTTGTSTDPLSELGEKQAELIAGRFKDIPLDVIISSTYMRARQTGMAIAQHKDCPFEESHLFTEIKQPTELEGTPFDAPELLHIREFRHSNWGNEGVHHSDEENFFDVQLRARKALTFLAQRSEHEIAVTTHGAFLRAMIEEILMGELLTPAITTAMMHKLEMTNTGITVIGFEKDAWKLISWNDTNHLEPLEG
ncbi:alpha-ribazole phosphatase [soil metagenome]